MSDIIPVLNGGSSSLKFSIFEIVGEQSLALRITGQIEGLGRSPRSCALRSSRWTREEPPISAWRMTASLPERRSFAIDDSIGIKVDRYYPKMKAGRVLMDGALASTATAISSPNEIGKLSPNSLGDIDPTSCVFFQTVEKSSLLQGIDCVKFKQSLVV